MGKEKIHDLIDMLVEKYPAAFSVRNRKPLKIGIDQDLIAVDPEIAALGFSARRKLFQAYCGHRFYLRNVIAGADRVDLNGVPTGKPTDDQIEDAKRRLNGYYEYLKSKGEVVVKAKAVKKPLPAPGPRLIGLADLRAAVAARKAATA